MEGTRSIAKERFRSKLPFRCPLAEKFLARALKEEWAKQRSFYERFRLLDDFRFGQSSQWNFLNSGPGAVQKRRTIQLAQEEREDEN
jgi:hypothetical protein